MKQSLEAQLALLQRMVTELRHDRYTDLQLQAALSQIFAMLGDMRREIVEASNGQTDNSAQ